MADKIMKTLTIGDNTYEIVDEAARNDISTLSTLVGDEAVSTQITNAVDDIQIGGTNLIRETGWYTDVAPTNVGWLYSSGAFIEYPYDTYPNADDFYNNGYIHWTGETSGDCNTPTIKTKAGEVYTLSFRHRGAGLQVHILGMNASGSQSWGPMQGFGNPTTTDCAYTFTIPSDRDVSSIYVVFRTTSGEAGVLGRIKLERGNKATAWSPSPEDLSTRIEALQDIQIGGRNLLRGTQYWDSAYWSYIGNQTVSGETVLVDATAETSGYKQTYQSISLQEGKTYTLSVDLLSAQSSAFTGVWITDSTLSQRHYAINLPAGTASQAKRYSGTFTVPSGSSSFAVYIRASAGASIQVQHIQLEEGNKATAWEPALEDIIPISRGGTGATDALTAITNLGGVPVLSAEGSSYDMNTILDTGVFGWYRFNGSTLNTAYKEGKTANTVGYIFNIPTGTTSGTRYGYQLAMHIGDYNLYSRTIYSETPTAWQKNKSGTIPISQGGTGATDAATARTNLGITPANIGAAAYSPIAYTEIDNIATSGLYRTTGTPALLIHLQWDVNFAYQIRNLYSAGNASTDCRRKHNGTWSNWETLYSSTKVIPVANGGTGATDATTARSNLGITPANIGAQPALGYTPIQQGGGTDQKTNKIYIGWTDAQLNAQVDSTSLGKIYTSYTDSNVSRINLVKSGNTSVAVNGTINVGSLSGVKQMITNINGASATISFYGTSEGSINATYYSKTDNKFLTYGVGFTYTSAGALTITKIMMYQIDSNGVSASAPSSVTIGNVYTIS